jgi:hypothetical protein
MSAGDTVLKCKSCGAESTGKYCPNCGQSMIIKRLSFHELIHEAFHFFTHLEKGFLYTLKMLLVSPGKMQKEYVEGDRVRHQKPFSMFFISATVCALIFYWVNSALIKYYHLGDTKETAFFHQYWVLLQVCMLPLYCSISFLCFKKAGYHFGEIVVSQLYTFSFVFLLLALIQLLKFIDPNLETRYIELPLIAGYSLITNLNFFNRLKRSAVILISLITIILLFLIAVSVQDKLVELIYA